MTSRPSTASPGIGASAARWPGCRCAWMARSSASCMSTGEIRRFGPDDLRLLEAVGARAALAIGHAQLRERERNLAETLQRSLLPRMLPSAAGLRWTARHLPRAPAGRSAGTSTTRSSCRASASGLTSAMSPARAGRRGGDGPGPRGAARLRAGGRRAGQRARAAGSLRRGDGCHRHGDVHRHRRRRR